MEVERGLRRLAGPDARRQAAEASPERRRNRSCRALVHGLDHGFAGRTDELVEFLLAHLLCVEHGQHVGGVVGRLDERDVFRR